MSVAVIVVGWVRAAVCLAFRLGPALMLPVTQRCGWMGGGAAVRRLSGVAASLVGYSARRGDHVRDGFSVCAANPPCNSLSVRGA